LRSSSTNAMVWGMLEPLPGGRDDVAGVIV